MRNKKCAQCGHEKPIEDFSKSYKNLCKACVAERERLKRKINKAFGVSDDMPNMPYVVSGATDSPHFIPNPRFIASVAAMQGMLASGMYQTNHARFIAEKSVEYADALLNELSKTDR